MLVLLGTTATAQARSHDRYHYALRMRASIRQHHAYAVAKAPFVYLTAFTRPARLTWNTHQLRRESLYWLRWDRHMEDGDVPYSQRLADYNALMCIHSKEGAWPDETGNSYNGGLQLSDGEESHNGYGVAGPGSADFFNRWGHAGHWPVYAQLLAGQHLRDNEGSFRAWSTAGACGL